MDAEAIRMNLTIRQAAEADLPAVLALSDALIAEGCCNGMVPDTFEYLRDWVIHVAEADGQLVGYAYGKETESRWSIGACQKGERYYDLEMLYVAPSHRGMGIGRALYETELARARSLNVSQMRLNAVNRDWKRLLHLYIDELGFNFWTATLYRDL